MGIQRVFCIQHTIIILIQNSDPLTLNGIGKPSGKLIPLSGGRGPKIRCQPGVIALDIITHQLAAVGIVLHVGDIFRRCFSVLIVYKDRGFHQSAPQMAFAALTAGQGIDHKGIDNPIGILRIAKCADQGLAGGQECSAHIITHGKQAIKLVLAICKAVLINEFIDRPLKCRGHLANLILCLFLGHGVFHIIVHLVLGAFCAVADGVAAIGFQVGRSTEAFIVFDKGNTSIADLHIRGRPDHRSHHQHSH